MPPLCAPVQVQTVQAATRKIASGKCVWWTLCNSDQKECRGTQRELCDKFGTNRSERSNRPAHNQLEQYIREESWKPRRRNWSWFPFYDKEAVVCDGIRKVSFQKYEIGGSHSDSTPTEQQLRDERKTLDTKRKTNRNKIKNIVY